MTTIRKVSFAVVVLLAGTFAAKAQDKLRLPTGPAPNYGVASLDKRGNVLVNRAVKEPVTETRTKVVEIDGKKVERTYSVIVYVTKIITSVRKPDSITVSKVSGKVILEEDFEDVFRNPVAVLLTAESKPLDPFYRKLFKPDTLVIGRKPSKPKRE